MNYEYTCQVYAYLIEKNMQFCFLEGDYILVTRELCESIIAMNQ